MSQDPPEPDPPEQSADIDQDARVSGRGRAYQAGRDQNITEFHWHSGPDPGVLDFAFAERDIANAQDTVAQVQESISEHHRLVGLLLQMLRGVQQAVRTLTDERDTLREELRARAEADAELRETRARLDDTRQRLEEAERIQTETSQRLEDAQRQRAEAELLKAEAADKVRRMEETLASLRREASATASAKPAEVERAANAQLPLMGETDQQVASDVLRRVDAVLQREAANLSQLREKVAETIAPEAESLPDAAPQPASDPVTATGELDGAPEASSGYMPPKPKPKPKPKQHRQAYLIVSRLEPWTVIKLTATVTPILGLAYVALSFSGAFRFVTTLPQHGNAGWWLLTGLSALLPPLLAAILIRIVNVLEPYVPIGAEITLREAGEPPRQAHLQVRSIYLPRTLWMLGVMGIVCGGVCGAYRMLSSSGALHVIALSADRSALGRIEVTAGLVAAVALVSVLMAQVSNYVVRPPEICLGETGDFDRRNNRQAWLALKRIEPKYVGFLSVVIGAFVAALYMGLYMTGALHQVYVFARHDTLDRVLATAGVVAAIVVGATLCASLYNAIARLIGGLPVTLAETD